jgi:hypothetical protein
MQREHVLKHALYGTPASQCYALRGSAARFKKNLLLFSLPCYTKNLPIGKVSAVSAAAGCQRHAGTADTHTPFLITYFDIQVCPAHSIDEIRRLHTCLPVYT